MRYVFVLRRESDVGFHNGVEVSDDCCAETKTQFHEWIDWKRRESNHFDRFCVCVPRQCWCLRNVLSLDFRCLILFLLV